MNLEKIMLQNIIKNITGIMLLVLICYPYFYFSQDNRQKQAMETSLKVLLSSEKMSPGIWEQSVEHYIAMYQNTIKDLIFLKKREIVLFPRDGSIPVDLQELPSENYIEFELFDEDNDISLYYSVISSKKLLELEGFLNIIESLVLGLILTISIFEFSSTADKYLINPIEKMLHKIQRIAEHPLDAASMEEQEDFIVEQFQDKKNMFYQHEQIQEADFDVFHLEKLIKRTGQLLAICFGQAGSEIIGSNIKASGFVNPMIAGKKVLGVFGFCNIRNFEQASVVLEEKVLVFVNKIAEILHKRVDQYCGHNNKNIGEAFLVVWKFKESEYFLNSQGNLQLIESDVTRNFADLSVVSFIKIIGDIYASADLRKYCRQHNFSSDFEGFAVNMGFGLHYGWAIEGAIGSDFKIDASYLSPNVNIAARLETASKQFGINLLISGQLQRILSVKCKKNLRLIDKVTVKGSVMPIELYTADLNLQMLHIIPEKRSVFDLTILTAEEKKRVRIMEKMKKRELHYQLQTGVIKASVEFSNGSDVHQMRQEFTSQFLNLWKTGISSYFAGNWQEARKVFLRTQSWFERRYDGPSTTLIEFMNGFDFEAPRNWKGFRSLLEK